MKEPHLEIGELTPIGDIKTGETEEIQGPPPPAIATDPVTGQLPFGWKFADE